VGRCVVSRARMEPGRRVHHHPISGSCSSLRPLRPLRLCVEKSEVDVLGNWAAGNAAALASKWGRRKRGGPIGGNLLVPPDEAVVFFFWL
jgi:hypothetical protein